MGNIHTIGDSHCYKGWNNVIHHHLGPLLCYTFGVAGLGKYNINSIGLKPNDSIIFCLGEIDCRVHVKKQIIKKRCLYQKVINEIIERYILAVKLRVHKLDFKLKNTSLFNVIPPVNSVSTRRPNPSEGLVPFNGCFEERKNYALYFNKCLKKKCKEEGFIFFDIWDNYANKDGSLKLELSDGSFHIGNGTHLNDFIKKFFS